MSLLGMEQKKIWVPKESTISKPKPKLINPPSAIGTGATSKAGFDKKYSQPKPKLLRHPKKKQGARKNKYRRKKVASYSTAPVKPKVKLERDPLKLMLLSAPSLKFLVAYQISVGAMPVTIEQVEDQGLLDLINQIKALRVSNYDSDFVRFFINLANNPDIDIEKHFPDLIKKYLGVEELAGKQQLLNAMLSYHALTEKNYEATNLCLALGASIDTKDNENTTVLLSALMKGYFDLAKFLIAKGANVNIKNIRGTSPLLIEARSRTPNMEIVNLLLEHGVDVNAQDFKGITPLLQAVVNENLKLAQLLLDHGADIDAQTTDGKTLLMLAGHFYTQKILVWLLNKGASVNIQDCKRRTPLMIFASNIFSEKQVETLLDNGADVTIKDNKGKTALWYARHKTFGPSNQKVIELLRRDEWCNIC